MTCGHSEERGGAVGSYFHGRPNMQSIPRALALSASVLALTVGSTFAQQITGTPGSPSATTTIDGKYLPNPPPPFGGTINMDAQDPMARFMRPGFLSVRQFSSDATTRTSRSWRS